MDLQYKSTGLRFPFTIPATLKYVQSNLLMTNSVKEKKKLNLFVWVILMDTGGMFDWSYFDKFKSKLNR
jgi:hypothetical protein